MDFKNLFEMVHLSTGIVFTNNEDIIIRKITRFYEGKEFKNIGDFLSELKKNKTLYQELINLITTSETYFYREFSQIEICVKKIQETSGKVKILSAPCASGEEPYTILIALLEAGVNLNNIEIYAIDINSDEIQNAKQAIYKERRLHKLSREIQEKYFINLNNGNFEIKTNLKKHIHFTQANIFELLPNNFSNFDIIFSRNMLIYFDQTAITKVEKIFYDKLKTNGLVFLGHADKIPNQCGFNKCIENGTSYYKK